MKALLFLMIVFSIGISVNTDEFGRVSLFGMEFLGAAQGLEAMHFDIFYLFCWIMLLVLHLVLISMFFLSQKSYFKNLLIWVPIGFIVFFVFVNFFSIFLLIPFLGIWLVALLYYFLKGKLNIKIKTNVLLLAILLCCIFAAFPRNGATLSQIGSDLMAAFSAIKSRDNRLMAVLWLLLIASSIALISFIFFRKKKYFGKLLMWIPTFFIAIFIVYSYLAFFFLIPFVLIWTIALIREDQQETKRFAYEKC